MRPFEGIRVLDLSHVLAGPFCTYQLAVLGADVIKIEPPYRPDMTRGEGVVPALNEELLGTYFLAQNAGKRAITLDLGNPEGRAVMERLVAGADVLFHNYALSSMATLGLDYDNVTKINPRLIYCSVSGFGATGPKAEHPAYDVVIQAFSGLMVANTPAGEKPARVGPPMVDYGTGAQAALAISAALMQRERTGTGQQIDVSMLDSALMLMSAATTDTLTDGNVQRAYTDVHPRHAGYGTYETRDALIMLGAYTDDQLARLMDAIGEPVRAAEIRGASPAETKAARDADVALLERRMTERTADEWEQHLNVTDIPAARVRGVDEALAHPQVTGRAGIQSVDSARGGPGQLPVSGFQYAHGGPLLTRPPPGFGEHTTEVLGELGYSHSEINRLKSSGAL